VSEKTFSFEYHGPLDEVEVSFPSGGFRVVKRGGTVEDVIESDARSMLDQPGNWRCLDLKASDAAIREARESGVNLLDVKGTGKGKAITVDDVKALAPEQPEAENGDMPIVPGGLTADFSGTDSPFATSDPVEPAENDDAAPTEADTTGTGDGETDGTVGEEEG
jgi:hypothetical protein